MAAQPFSSPATQCPNCGANVTSEQSSCPACGAPLSPGTASQEAQQQVLQQLVEKSNESLSSQGTNAAEAAFGIGCSLSGIVSLVLLLIVFLLGGRDWTLLAIVALVSALISTAIAAILATRAKSATIAATYNRIVRPEIEGYMRANRLSRQEFDILADRLVPEDAPLRNYLTLPPFEQREQTSAKE